MNRRRFLAVLGAGAMSTACVPWWPEHGVWNPCLGSPMPTKLAGHALLRKVWDGVAAEACWDSHVHLFGAGDRAAGVWLNSAMRDAWRHPVQYAKFRFYLNAACPAADAAIDEGVVARLAELADEFPPGVKFLLLAFDFHHDTAGRRVEAASPFHIADDYAAALAAARPARFEWIASIHPYRRDAVAALAAAVGKGARAVKWLPSVMGIDPASPACDSFYDALAQHDLPLLSHGGAEQAVDGGGAQELDNPLRLRRVLERGVRVIVAHCASLGTGVDLDRGPDGPRLDNFALFTRLMEERRYDGRLFGDISAIAQINRSGRTLRTLLQRDDWHGRLLNGSDYPLPAILPLFSLRTLVADGFITAEEAAVLAEIRRYNALLFDWTLKRRLAAEGRRFAPAVFETRRVFDRRYPRAAGGATV